MCTPTRTPVIYFEIKAAANECWVFLSVLLRDAEARYRDGSQPISVESSDVMPPHQDQAMRAPARKDVINTANVKRDRDRATGLV